MNVIKSEEDFKKELGSTKSVLTVIHFLAEWAPQCSQVTDVLKELKNDRDCSKVQFIQVGVSKGLRLCLTNSTVLIPLCESVSLSHLQQ